MRKTTIKALTFAKTAGAIVLGLAITYKGYDLAVKYQAYSTVQNFSGGLNDIVEDSGRLTDSLSVRKDALAGGNALHRIARTGREIDAKTWGVLSAEINHYAEGLPKAYKRIEAIGREIDSTREQIAGIVIDQQVPDLKSMLPAGITFEASDFEKASVLALEFNDRAFATDALQIEGNKRINGTKGRVDLQVATSRLAGLYKDASIVANTIATQVTAEPTIAYKILKLRESSLVDAWSAVKKSAEEKTAFHSELVSTLFKMMVLLVAGFFYFAFRSNTDYAKRVGAEEEHFRTESLELARQASILSEIASNSETPMIVLDNNEEIRWASDSFTNLCPNNGKGKWTQMMKRSLVDTSMDTMIKGSVKFMGNLEKDYLLKSRVSKNGRVLQFIEMESYIKEIKKGEAPSVPGKTLGLDHESTHFVVQDLMEDTADGLNISLGKELVTTTGMAKLPTVSALPAAEIKNGVMDLVLGLNRYFDYKAQNATGIELDFAKARGKMTIKVKFNGTHFVAGSVNEEIRMKNVSYGTLGQILQEAEDAVSTHLGQIALKNIAERGKGNSCLVEITLDEGKRRHAPTPATRPSLSPRVGNA
jgi:hypothetical protein